MDLDPRILQVEPPEEYHYLFGCCCYWPVTKSARIVAFFSLLSFILNLVLLLFSTIQSAIHLLVELSIILIEFTCIVSLFYGLAQKKAGFLKPYLFFGVIWNACLIILWVLCLIQLFDQNGFKFDVLLSWSEFVEFDPNIETFEAISFWITLFLIIALTVAILIGFWFLHIILTTYQYLIYREMQLWDQLPENKLLLVEEPSAIINNEEQNDPIIESLLTKM